MTTDRRPTCRRSSADMSIERDLTHAAFTEFLATQPTLAPLATELNDTVDGNVTATREIQARSTNFC